MKKLLPIFMFLCAMHPTFAQQNIVIHLKDGSSVSYSNEDIDFIEMDAPSGKHGKATEPVSVPVNLGLSVNWASCNIGSNASEDVGDKYSWDETVNEISLSDNGWRLPNKEEWQELLEKCTWEWTVRNGIGGRTVTGPSGKSIFLPATGLLLDGEPCIVGSIGIYWSATTSAEETNSSAAQYFDSANIYQISLPRTNLFAVRLVTENDAPDGISAPQEYRNGNMNIYRNGNMLTISGIGKQGISVFSHDGQQQMPHITRTPSTATINFSKLPKGVYIIKVADNPAIKFATM